MHRWLQIHKWNLIALTVSHPQLISISEFSLCTSWSHVTNSIKFGCLLNEVWLPHIVAWIIGCMLPPPPSQTLSELIFRSYNRDPEYCFLSKKWEKAKRTYKKCLVFSKSRDPSKLWSLLRPHSHKISDTSPTFLHDLCWCVNWSHVTDSLKFECHPIKTFLAGLTYGGIHSLSMVSSSYRYGGVSGGSSCSSSLLE